MSFIIRNIAGTPVDINDLGLRLETGEDVDLTEEAAKDIAISVDLPSAISNGDIIALDPLDGVSPLTIVQSLEVVGTANDSHYGIRGGKLNQIDNVNTGNPPNDYVLTFDLPNNEWQAKVSQGGGGGNNDSVRESVTVLSHGFTSGQPVYYDGTTWQLAQANSVNALATAIIDVTGLDTFDIVSDGDIVTMSGLVAGSWYYVDDASPGQLTTTEPVNFSNPIGYAESATRFHVVSIRAVDKSAGVDPVSDKKIITQNGHGFTTGQPIYFNGTTWQLAQANNINTLATEIAIVIDVNIFEAVTLGSVDGLAGLIPGAWYFVDDTTPGTLILTEPAIFSNPMAIAETTSKLFVIPMRAVDYTNA